MKAFKKIVALMLLISLVFSGAAFAATPDEIAESTDAGMEWLAEMQNPDGSWGDFYPDSLARTGLALLKFETHALNDPEFDGPFDPDYPFMSTVVDGLDYLLSSAAVVSIGLQPAGDPDTNGNGTGISLVPGGHHEIYVTSIALMAVTASGNPTRIVTTGPLSGMNYGDVAQDMVDFLAWGQTDPGSPYQGGWNYHAMNAQNFRSDNSISGYAVMGLAFAEHPVYGFESTIPGFVRDELDLWVNFIQNDTSGGSGYTHPNDWVNLLKTGNLLHQMAFLGYTPDDPRVEAAIGYIEANWNVPNNDPGWQAPSVKNYQATFAMMKGFEAYGIETINVGGDPTFDWFEDVSNKLLAEQLPNGSWPITDWDYEDNHVLSTTWALLTLQKVAPPPPITVIDINIKPGSDPNAVKAKAKGVLPIAILGSEDFDAMYVDDITIRLTMEGSAMEIEPLRWAYEDVSSDFAPYEGDGYLDMILHFDMEDVLALIGPDPEGVIELIIIGEDMGGLAFRGTDVILVVPKVK